MVTFLMCPTVTKTQVSLASVAWPLYYLSNTLSKECVRLSIPRNFQNICLCVCLPSRNFPIPRHIPTPDLDINISCSYSHFLPASLLHIERYTHKPTSLLVFPFLAKVTTIYRGVWAKISRHNSWSLFSTCCQYLIHQYPVGCIYKTHPI